MEGGDNGVKYIPVFGSDGTVRVHVLVDDEDHEHLSQWRWQLSRGRYAHRTTTSPKRSIYMHRELMGLELGDPRHVDHVNRKTFDNRKANLRIVTRAQQSQNLTPYGKSKYRGVSKHRDGKWIARVTLNGTTHYLGLFEGEEDAGKAASDFRAKHMTHSEEAWANVG